MNGTPSATVISFKRPATSICNCSDSTTHGPAIRNSGLSRPTSNPHSFIAEEFLSCRRLLLLAALARGLVLQRRLHVADEQRMAVPRCALELGVELHADEPRMRHLRQLDDLGQLLALCDRRDHQ